MSLNDLFIKSAALGCEGPPLEAERPSNYKEAPYIGPNGNWWIGDYDTGQNANGLAGSTPYIGDNGNWWIKDKDTGVQAMGEGSVPVRAEDIFNLNAFNRVVARMVVTEGKDPEPAWSADGRTLSNVLIKELNTYGTYDVVDDWYDGTPMDDSKIDQDGIYVKYQDKYLLQNLGEYGQVLQKDTMLDIRGLSSKDIILLKIGYYKSVQLNGYHTTGDTPTPIEYTITSSSVTDDGGSVIIVEGLKLECKFEDTIYASYFGVSGVATAAFNLTALKNIALAAKKYNTSNVIVDRSVILDNTSMVEFVDCNNLSVSFTEPTYITNYRGFQFTNCPNVTVSGVIDGSNLSTVGVTVKNCESYNIVSLQVINIGNTTAVGCRGIEIIGNSNNGVIDTAIVDKVTSNAVSTGIVYSADGEDYPKNNKVVNSTIKEIRPNTDGDGIKTLLLGKTTNLMIDNCHFENCTKRAIKLQSRGDIVSNCIINGESLYPIDFQDGHGKAFNISGTITSPFEALISCLNYNVELTDIDFKVSLPIESITNTCRGIDIKKITADGLTSGYFNFKNIRLEKCSELRFREASNASLSFDNVVVGQNKANYLIQLNDQIISRLTIINSNLEVPNPTFFGIVKGDANVADFNIHSNLYGNQIFEARGTSFRNKSVTYIDNIKTGYGAISYYTQRGTKREYFGLNTPPVASIALLLDAKRGDIAYNRNQYSNNIDKWICTEDGNGTSSVGTWKTCYISDVATTSLSGVVKKSAAVADITTEDAIDLPTALVLVNDLKSKLNAKLIADRNSGQQSII